MSAWRAVPLLLLGLATGPAQAQTPAGFALQTFEPAPAGDRFFTVPDVTTPGHLAPAAALSFSWARDPLVLLQGGQPVPGGILVHRQFWAFLQGSLGISDRVLVDVSLPLALYQSGSQYFSSLPPVATTGLGDLKVGARTPLGRVGPLDLAGEADLWLPTGSQAAFTSDGSLRAQGRLLGHGELGSLEYGGALGLLYRETSDRVITTIGPAVTYAAAGAWRIGEWRVGPELYGRYQFDGTATSPLEGLLGGHWQRGAFDVGLALGTGFDRSAGAAPFRVIAQASWRPPARPAGPSADELARQAAARAAEEQAAAEATRLAAERAAVEAAALAAAQAEHARATADRDGDGIPDLVDACPDVKGEPSADPALNGCPPPAPPPPPAAPALVKLTAERIEILQAVQFETSKDVIRAESEKLLGEVAQVLVSHPGITRVLVEGHTDSQGGKDFNVELSQKRARAVKRWLVERGGVDEARLTTEGFGPTRPIDTNDTKEGRARNRRVEFRIVEQR